MRGFPRRWASAPKCRLLWLPGARPVGTQTAASGPPSASSSGNGAWGPLAACAFPGARALQDVHVPVGFIERVTHRAAVGFGGAPTEGNRQYAMSAHLEVAEAIFDIGHALAGHLGPLVVEENYELVASPAVGLVFMADRAAQEMADIPQDFVP